MFSPVLQLYHTMIDGFILSFTWFLAFALILCKDGFTFGLIWFLHFILSNKVQRQKCISCVTSCSFAPYYYFLFFYLPVLCGSFVHLQGRRQTIYCLFPIPNPNQPLSRQRSAIKKKFKRAKIFYIFIVSEKHSKRNVVWYLVGRLGTEYLIGAYRKRLDKWNGFLETDCFVARSIHTSQWS